MNLTYNRIPLQLLTIRNALWTSPSRAAHGHTVSATCCVAVDSALLLIHQWPIPLPHPSPHALQSLKTPNTFYIWKSAQDMWGTRHIQREICLSVTHAILWQRKDTQQASCTWRQCKYRGFEMHIYQTHQIPFSEINKPNRFAGTPLRSTGHSWCLASALAWPRLRKVSVVI